MNPLDKILSDLADHSCERISRSVIRTLTKMTDGMQSEKDSPLKNVWDEICVQVQREESVLWEIYQETIESLIINAVKELDAATQQAIWLQTEEGWDWKWDHGDEEGASIPITLEPIVVYVLKDFVLAAAADWTNKRIEHYLER